ncbi:hypothetical protein BDK51DRAFT_43166 [Blyttiomyces helicus]|uniref:BTB domain-containing protein n=1 Tax=Blyttiomyces helicus TaxID=388810 RepID=A0A4P9WT83_9FUNG|nr:hypothetical protein BDK51DRAFT_43166 [Blyttiomyces helicus]|eukprot:RKO94550.1 hypothetical protein BDK51DRAFT_43166 [Blyttiomyces helicus]
MKEPRDLHRFSRYFLNGRFADALLRVQVEPKHAKNLSTGSGSCRSGFSDVPVHRIVLASVSPYFDALFSSSPLAWEPASQIIAEHARTSTHVTPFPSYNAPPSCLPNWLGVWPLTVEEEDSLRLVLEWCYFGDSVALTLRRCWKVLALARELDMPLLERRVQDWVREEVVEPRSATEVEWFDFIVGAVRSGAQTDAIARTLTAAAAGSAHALEHRSHSGETRGGTVGEFAKFTFLHRLVERQRVVGDPLEAGHVQRLFSCVRLGGFSMEELEIAYADPMLPREVIAEALMLNLKQRSESISSSITATSLSDSTASPGPICSNIPQGQEAKRPAPSEAAIPRRRSSEFDRQDSMGSVSTLSSFPLTTSMSTTLSRWTEPVDLTPTRTFRPSSPPSVPSEVEKWHGEGAAVAHCETRGERPVSRPVKALSFRSERLQIDDDASLGSIGRSSLSLAAGSATSPRSSEGTRRYHRHAEFLEGVEYPAQRLMDRSNRADPAQSDATFVNPTSQSPPSPSPPQPEAEKRQDAEPSRRFEDLSFSGPDLTFSDPRPMQELAEVRRQLDEFILRKAEQRRRKQVMHHIQSHPKQVRIAQQSERQHAPAAVPGSQNSHSDALRRREATAAPGAVLKPAHAESEEKTYEEPPSTSDVLEAVRLRLEGIAGYAASSNVSTACGSPPLGFTPPVRRSTQSDLSERMNGTELHNDYSPARKDDTVKTADLLARLRKLRADDGDVTIEAEGEQNATAPDAIVADIEDGLMDTWVTDDPPFEVADDEWELAQHNGDSGEVLKTAERDSLDRIYGGHTAKMASAAVQRGAMRQLKRPPNGTMQPAVPAALQERRQPGALYNRRGASASVSFEVRMRRVTPSNPLPHTPATGVGLLDATGKDAGCLRGPAWKSSSSTIGDDSDGFTGPSSLARTPPVAYRHSPMFGSRTWGPSSAAPLDPDFGVGEGPGIFRMVGLKHGAGASEEGGKLKKLKDFFKSGFSS